MIIRLVKFVAECKCYRKKYVANHVYYRQKNVLDDEMLIKLMKNTSKISKKIFVFDMLNIYI